MNTKRLGLWVASCWLPMTVAVAQQPPQAGDSLRMLEERELTLPPATEPVLEVPMPGPAAVPQSDVRIPVKQFRIEGNHNVATEELLALLTDLTGQTLSLAQLYQAADRLTAYYRGEGYLVSRAYLPAQEIGEDGIITLAVAEGRYGKVTLENQSRLRDGLPRAMLRGLESGDAVTLKPLERRVLLLNDLPGTRASSSLSAGSEPGQSDLTVTLQDEPRFSGALTLDNHGNRHTGEYRLGAQLNVANPLGLGDAFSLHLLGSDEEQLYYQARYDAPVGPWGTRVGVATSKMDYELGGDFEQLDAKGTAETFGLFVSHPWLRYRHLNLRSHLQVDRKKLEDELFGGLIIGKKKANNVTVGLSGDWRDGVGGGGINAFTLNWVQGHLRGDTAEGGSFGKLQFSLLRLQHLNRTFSLYTALQGQLTDGNLDSSERFSLGGPYAIRSYPVGEASADEGVVVTTELRYQWRPAWRFKTFADAGYARLVRHPEHAGNHHRNLSGVGLGTDWQPHPRLTVSAASAWRTGDHATSDKERTPRTWAQVQWAF